MDAFPQWLMANKCYLDLLFIGLVMALLIAANVLEGDGEPSDVPADLRSNEPTDGDA